MIALSNAIDALIHRIGHLVAWANVVLIGVILVQVTLRYGFHHGLVPLEELQWHLYALAAMFGLSYGLSADSHIRVDILHQHFPPRLQAAVEILGILCLLLPFAGVILHHSLDWLADSYRLNEASENPTGLPYRWLIKSVVPVSFGLLILAALARLLRATHRLLGKEDAGGD